MNYEINNYETKLDFFEIDKRCYGNNIVDYEKEYELQNDSIKHYTIESFLSPGCGPRKFNYNSVCRNSLTSISEQKKIDNIYSNNRLIYNGNLNKFDNNNYINENNSITLLSLTDKIYEDEEHFNKGIIRKRNSKFENNSLKKEKSSSRFGGNNNKKTNRKSLFTSKELNRKFSKKDIKFKRKRGSVVMENRNKSNLNLFDKFKERKSSVIFDNENEKSNNYTNIEEKIDKINKDKITVEENNKKSKFKKLSNKQIENENRNSLKSCQANSLKNKNKTVKTMKTKKKNKLSLGELDNKEKEEKSTSKKTNNIKIDDKKKNNSKKVSNKSNNIQIHKNKKINEERKFITCLFCCLNS
jgi:hypothetical protein